MDSLTQIVLGAAVGNATLGKRIGNKAILYGAIAGTIPDLDVIFGKFTDTITAIEWHRGFSHSILFCILMSPVFGWLVNKLERKFNLGWKPWAMLFFWGMFTHPLLDAFTTWGTQLLWPLDISLAFNSIFVVDPLYTLPFLTLTVLSMFYKRESETRAKLNRAGLIISSAYLLLTVGLKFLVTQKFEKALVEQNISYSQISTRPTPMNTILWNANVETSDSYLIGDYSFFDTKPITFKAYSKNREASQQLMEKPNVKRLIDISKGWFILEHKNDTWYFNDLRFGTIPKKEGSPMFVFSYELEEVDVKIIATETPKNQQDAQFLLATLWGRLKGN